MLIGSPGSRASAPSATAEASSVAQRMPRPDRDSAAWLDRLGSSGPERDLAIGALHELLVRAARFEVRRRLATLPHRRGADPEDLAQQSADDAVVAILAKLGDFRGESRFTTWACKFVLYAAAANVRKRAWQGRELPLEADAWQRIADWRSGPHAETETSDLLTALREAIACDLTPHQREVVVSLALNEVPIDVLAERLDTTRGALYKALHDARRKLRASLAARGMSVEGHFERNTTT